MLGLSPDLRVQDPILDARYYLDLGARLADGKGWGGEPIFMSPLYPALLGGLFRLAPPTPFTVHVVQALLGLASGLLLWGCVRRKLGDDVALGAAALYALCGPILGMESQVLTESLLLFLTTLALWLWPSPTWSAAASVGLGIVLGLLGVGRGVYLLLVPVAACHWLWMSRRRGLVPLATFAVGLLVALAPLAIHQTKTSGTFQLLTLNGGLNLYIGNNAQARGIYSVPREVQLESDITATRAASIDAGRKLTMLEGSRHWSERARSFWRDSPGRAIWLTGRKALLYFTPREIPQVEDFQVLRELHWPLRVAFVDFAWLLPLALYGVLVRIRGRSSDLLPWVFPVAVGFAATVVFFATGRYRVPVLPGFLALAAIGLTEGIRAVAARRWSMLVVLVPIVAAAQFPLPSYPHEKARAFDAYQMAIRESRRQRPDAALAQYQRATTIDPSDGAAWNGVGATLVRLGRLPEATEAYLRAVELAPRSPQVHYNLGVVYGRLGRDDLALPLLARAAELDPMDPGIHTDYGIALFRTGQPDRAEREWRRALELAPDFVPARRALESLPR